IWPQTSVQPDHPGTARARRGPVLFRKAGFATVPACSLGDDMSGSQRFSVRDKAILVTGASSGFGAQFARVLAREGEKVGLAARRVGPRESIAAEVRRAGGTATAVKLDVSDSASIKEAVKTVADEFGRIDVLVNNSGVSITKPLL